VSRLTRNTLRALALALAAGAIAVVLTAQSRAHEFLTNPRETRRVPDRTPAALGLPYEDVSVTSPDGVPLVGWYLKSRNGAVVIVQHGYKDHRGMMLDLAALLHRHGYGVLINTVRAHDRSGGETITFGHLEMQDLAAWEVSLRERHDLEPGRLGIFGASMGGSLAIQFAARNPRIRAVVADGAFSSIDDTIETSVRFFTGLPAFPFAPLIRFLAEREAGIRAASVAATAWIGQISPRPIFLLQGGADVVVSPESGRRLFEAANEPKELWFEPALGHVEFLKAHPEEFERRLVGFYDRHLRGKAKERP
jgi:fermentation-respiration switch protein FrsA (DUF1100 family)